MQKPIAKEDIIRQPRQERSQKRVHQILEATKRIIAKKGCAGLTISGIAKEAEITAGSMYQYFPNKSAIIFALGEQYLLKTRQQIAEKLLQAPTSRSEFQLLLMDLFDSYSKLHCNDPVVRDIWMGASVDKEMRDLDWEDTQQNVFTLMEIARPLFPKEMHNELETKLLLVIQFATVSTKTAIDSPKEDMAKILETARGMLDELWISLESKATALEK